MRFAKSSGDGWAGRAVLQHQACLQGAQCFVVDLAFNLCPICFCEIEARVADMLLGSAAVGQQQQAFRILVESASRINVGDGNIRGQSVRLRATELRNNIEWFVEQNELSHIASIADFRLSFGYTAYKLCKSGGGLRSEWPPPLPIRPAVVSLV